MSELCEQKLNDLQRAVREHVTELDGIMKGPSSYERGQQIAKSVSNLELALTASIIQIEPQVMAKLKHPSALTSPASAAMPGTLRLDPMAKPSSPAASTPGRRKRKQR
jgi:hypothetical protein